MEEEDLIIIQVIFKFEDGRLYNFDVDRTTTFYETKKILANAAYKLFFDKEIFDFSFFIILAI